MPYNTGLGYSKASRHFSKRGTYALVALRSAERVVSGIRDFTESNYNNNNAAAAYIAAFLRFSEYRKVTPKATRSVTERPSRIARTLDECIPQ